ncbi:MAG TPA: substrate-binding domain-containing protein [Defluviitoga sp.]|nr:substrate-binding domain-containing protein [Defluviitoga sp.]HOP25278.1 substrate-binding domain-containing protein [Defluviitoga sp.]HPZ29489.1 substrate-binding domain-containing protein [Defluviitoga sp.]HQD63305.1 substrate-binding domain-containing protein [Defluviitoga sp.]
MATIRDVSRVSGYSIATVSRVLNGSDNVSPETRKKVLKAVKELNYKRSDSMKGSSYKVVGVLVPDLFGYYYGTIAEGIEEVLIKSHIEMFLSTFRNSIEKEKEALDEFFGRKVDGIIACTTYDDEEYLEKFVTTGIPVVALDRDHSDLKIDIITIENYNSTLKIAQYLYDMGHRRVAHVEGPQKIYSALERKRAFQDFAQKNKDFEVIFIPAAFDAQSGYTSIKQYLKKNGKDFTAVFFVNDWVALGGLKALKEAGYSCPDDVSVVGFDDSPFARYLHPSLTTICQPMYEMGLNAAKLMVEKLEGKKESRVKRRIILPTEIVVRDSVKKI